MYICGRKGNPIVNGQNLCKCRKTREGKLTSTKQVTENSNKIFSSLRFFFTAFVNDKNLLFKS